MARTVKVIGFSVPPEIADEFDALCEKNKCTKSEMFRLMYRTYKELMTSRENKDQMEFFLPEPTKRIV